MIAWLLPVNIEPPERPVMFECLVLHGFQFVSLLTICKMSHAAPRMGSHIAAVSDTVSIHGNATGDATAAPAAKLVACSAVGCTLILLPTLINSSAYAQFVQAHCHIEIFLNLPECLPLKHLLLNKAKRIDLALCDLYQIVIH